MKPTMYVANVGEDGSERLLAEVKAYAAKEDAPVVPISASIEAPKESAKKEGLLSGLFGRKK